MPRPLPLSTRQAIIALRQRHHSQPEIACQLEVSLSSVKSIIRRYAESGEAGLQPNYDNCGPHSPTTCARQVRMFCALKTWHPGWGYDKIGSLIQAKHPSMRLANRRTVYRWWHAKDLMRKRSKPPQSAKQWASSPHQIWQIDAKEMMLLKDNQRYCWLNIVDEHTGTVIDPPVFPLRKDIKSQPS